MADVTFIGLGLMGAALAEVSIKAGFETVVWNRTPSKADALVKLGAEYTENVADAVSESPVTIICVGDYDIADTILNNDDVTAVLKGKTLVQLTSGSSGDAIKMNEWISTAGAKYVDGGIEGYPSDIGTDESMFFISGNQDGVREAEPILKTLAPVLHNLGDDPARASAMYSAMLSGSFGMIFGMMQAVAICEATGIDIKQYLKIVSPVYDTDKELVMEMAEKCADDRLDEREATLSVWNETLNPIIETLSENGLNADMARLMRNMLEKSERDGFADHDLAALINVIRNK
ncbi:NAD(P)-dependent oxidoreductase [Pseudemcibacter aquimaris]|uniref:NAD(P)-dependent oxidoreductase n=1 Tax=Pseudemcibacter aquimaris TaxID=2857064 RepID=UPI00201261D1|nr:NAD(P)-binding domain-containing protein [Pseudemcibacter aquimaris]MCC3859600.1 NAD(P)-binding domain-containing protein [Pseudemcibacter aquimaris]WDU59996.1 NAD(P)-binding domain-containing protein [Pseudemcibacter aquimaris]